jgi:phosphomannomutase
MFMAANSGIEMRNVKLQEISQLSGVSFGTSGARGLVSDMTDDVCYAYTAAFLQTVAVGAESVVIGHDLRPSSPQITAACAAAVRDAGCRLVYVGALPTPAIAYFAAEIKLPAIVITGSHIPFDRNGIKFYSATGEISKTDEQAILASEVNLRVVVGPEVLPPTDDTAVSLYISRYVDFFGRGILAGMRVAVYEHSSVARDLIRLVLELLGAEVISLGRTDTFVPIDTEAVRTEDVEQAKRWAAEYAFDAIVSTDGDADRPLIGDENGNWLRGDVVGIVCAGFLGADHVVTPVSCNTAVEKCGLFRSVLRSRIGSPYVIDAMAEAAVQGEVVVGYEANGGFLLGSEIERTGTKLKPLVTRDALLPIIAVLVMAREKGYRVSQLTLELPARFTASDRLQNISPQASCALIARLQDDRQQLEELLGDNQNGVTVAIDQTDGLRVTFAAGAIVHLRPSGNAPELRCYAEADDQDRAARLCRCCLQKIELLLR